MDDVMVSDFTRRIFNYLVDTVPDNIPVTYGQVANDVGGMAWGLGQNLGVIWEFCTANGHPHLNAMVVNSDTGLPGEAYTPNGHAVTRSEWEQIMNSIRIYPWDRIEIL